MCSIYSLNLLCFPFARAKSAPLHLAVFSQLYEDYLCLWQRQMSNVLNPFRLCQNPLSHSVQLKICTNQGYFRIGARHRSWTTSSKVRLKVIRISAPFPYNLEQDVQAENLLLPLSSRSKQMNKSASCGHIFLPYWHNRAHFLPIPPRDRSHSNSYFVPL